LRETEIWLKAERAREQRKKMESLSVPINFLMIKGLMALAFFTPLGKREFFR
jgi:hypothetical protein